MMNEIVVQEDGKGLLDEVGIRTEPYKKGYYTADSIECVSTLCSKAIGAGAQVFNLISIEDVKFDGERVNGLVINWSAVEMAKLHVDPLTIGSRFAIDATGHDLEVVRVLKRKAGVKLNTPSGDVEGERPMWAEKGEIAVVENAKEGKYTGSERLARHVFNREEGKPTEYLVVGGNENALSDDECDEIRDLLRKNHEPD